MKHTSDINRSDIETWLSTPRYKRYLEIAKDDDTLALELYLWNIGLAQAVLRDVSFFEVALRNAYDRAISSVWNGNDHWLFDDASPARRPILRTNKRGKVKDANRLNRNTIDHLASNLGHNPSPDKVISNLTFGFWAHMTDRAMSEICGYRRFMLHGQLESRVITLIARFLKSTMYATVRRIMSIYLRPMVKHARLLRHARMLLSSFLS
ncbi:MAG: hypothetical protein ACLTDR_02885 [Adlercreutzia equolifaciens]